VTEFNAMIEFEVSADHPNAEAVADELVDALRDFHPAVGRGPSGRLEATVTIEARNIEQASGLAWTLAHQTMPVPVFSFRVLPTAEFDRLVDAI
jgi:hypothetical protein